MDTKIEEVTDFIINWSISINHLDGKEVFKNYYEEILLKRFKRSKDSILLNYKLFFKKIGLIDKNLNPTDILKWIINLMEKNEVKLSEIIHYLILIKGEYLQLLKDIDEIQQKQRFFEKGNKSELLKEIRQIRNSLGLKDKGWRLDKEKVLSEFERSGEEWFRVVICELFKKGYYKSLSSLLEAISRRFANYYFHKNLGTNFLLKKDFQIPIGYKINWDYINKLVKKYDKFISTEKQLTDFLNFSS